jgi:DNA topoisomerase-1
LIHLLILSAQKNAAAVFKLEDVKLVYTHDKQEGIRRIKKGKGFLYLSEEKKITDENTLKRIHKLAIPPAWTNVWICKKENGHLQATGLDALGRKQYRYHSLWNELQGKNKFHNMEDFASTLPSIRKQITKDLQLKGLPLRKVLATIVSLMDYTGIRIGNSSYEKMYGSFGITTMKDRHVKISGPEAVFSFIGKKGIHHRVSLRNPKLAKIIRQCKEIPGKELFQYIDEDGNHKPVDSGMVNEYIREISGKHFTSKDFRTWAGSLYATECFLQPGDLNQKRINKIIDTVASRLGNTRAVCRKYYIHPAVIDYFLNEPTHHSNGITKNKNGLSNEEKMLLHIMQKQKLTAK